MEGYALLASNQGEHLFEDAILDDHRELAHEVEFALLVEWLISVLVLVRVVLRFVLLYVFLLLLALLMLYEIFILLLLLLLSLLLLLELLHLAFQHAVRPDREHLAPRVLLEHVVEERG